MSRTRALVLVLGAMLSGALASSVASGVDKVDKSAIDAALSGLVESKALVGVSALVYGRYATAANTLFWVDPLNKITAVLFTQYKPFGKVPLHKVFRDAVYSHIPDALAH
jgi:hypothetical protein